MWSLGTGELVRTPNALIHSVAVSKDGQHVISGGGGGDARIRVWRMSRIA
jgi:hypothetical protein